LFLFLNKFMFLKSNLYPLEIFSLQYGISLKKMYLLSQLKGSNPNNKRFKLTRKQNLFVKENFDLEFYLYFKTYINRRLKFIWSIRLYRGLRHKLQLPSRGQRTHSNRNTKRKFFF